MARLCLSLLLALSLVACQAENSSSTDADTYGSNSGGTPEFLAAKAIFTQSCSGTCHSYHARTEAQLVTEGVLVAGNPEASKLYYRLSASAGGPGPKNMPQGGSALSSTQLQQIRAWILNATP